MMSIFAPDEAAQQIFGRSHYGAEGEEDEVDVDLRVLDEDLDDDIAESDEYGFYGANIEVSDVDKAAQAAAWKLGPAIRVMDSPHVLARKIANATGSDALAQAFESNFKSELDDIVNQIAAQDTDDLAEAVALGVNAAAFHDPTWDDAFKRAWNESDGLQETFKSMFQNADDAAWDYFTDDVVNVAKAVAPFTDDQVINKVALSIWAADQVGMNPYPEIATELQRRGAVMIDDSETGVQAVQTWAEAEPAGQEKSFADYITPRNIVGAGYIFSAGIPALKRLGQVLGITR